MSGVKNLRAMFETKEDSGMSPPDRGRSPAGSVGGGSNGTSPRPLSKVRTSFVAVERNGQLGSQWGLRKESSTDPSLAERRMSFSINEDSDKAVAEQKETVNSELAARKASTVITEMIPETAVETPPLESEKKSGYMNDKPPLGRVALAASKPSANLGKETWVEVEDAKPLPGGSTSSEAFSRGAAMTNGDGVSGPLNGKIEGKAKLVVGTRSTGKSARAEHSTKPGPIAASMTINTKPISKSAKSPSTPKTPTTPERSSRTLLLKPITATSSTASTMSVEKKASKQSLSFAGPPKPAGRPTTSSTIASASETKSAHTSPSTGFHKPKPRSPTRPVKLPASLTAPTNSSLSKVTTSAVISNRQSFAPSTKAASRSPSRIGVASKLSSAQLRRKPSRLNENDRPALGRPSTSAVKKQPSRQSLSKDPVVTDESFLARMMRPTTSSASKTAEKVVSPPRKPPVARPIARDVPPHQPSFSRDGLPHKTTLPSKPDLWHMFNGPGIEKSKPHLRPREVAHRSEGVHAAEPHLEDEEDETFPLCEDDGTNGKLGREEKASVAKVTEVNPIDEEPTTPDVGKGKEVERHEAEAEPEVEVLAPPAEEELHVEEMKVTVVNGTDVEEQHSGVTEQSAGDLEEKQESDTAEKEEEEILGNEEEQEEVKVDTGADTAA